MEDKSGYAIMLLVAGLLATLLYLSKMENERNAESMGFDRKYKYFPETPTVDMTFEQKMPPELSIVQGTPIVLRFFRDVNTMANVIVALSPIVNAPEKDAEAIRINVKALDGLARPRGEGSCTLFLQSFTTSACIMMSDWSLFACYQLLPDGKRVVHLAAFDAIPSKEDCQKLSEVPENIARVENKFWLTRLVLP